MGIKITKSSKPAGGNIKAPNTKRKAPKGSTYALKGGNKKVIPKHDPNVVG